MRIGKIMIRDPITVNPETTVLEAIKIMQELNIRHLPVVEGGKVIGMLSIRDVIQTQVGKLTSEIHYLKDYITGSYT